VASEKAIGRWQFFVVNIFHDLKWAESYLEKLVAEAGNKIIGPDGHPSPPDKWF
jgi:hypothetical protein